MSNVLKDKNIQNNGLFCEKSSKNGSILQISKEIYEQALDNRGQIPKEYELDVFGMSVVYGYGLKNNSVFKDDGKYYCRYECGGSCD